MCVNSSSEWLSPMYWKHSYIQYILLMYSHDIQNRIGIETLPTKRELMIWVQDLMGFLILNVYLIAFYVIFPIWDPISWSQHPALELNITENFRHLWNTKNSSRRKTAEANKISMCGVDEAFILISNSYEVWQMNSGKYVCLWLNFFYFFV